MTFEKFESEVITLKKFFSIHCKDKHTNQKIEDYIVPYLDNSLEFEVYLCEECHNLLQYAIKKLQECPNDPKPKCRKCPNPCYDKDEYKKMAKIMRYSGMKLGMTKAAQRLKKIFGK